VTDINMQCMVSDLLLSIMLVNTNCHMQ